MAAPAGLFSCRGRGWIDAWRRLPDRRGPVGRFGRPLAPGRRMKWQTWTWQAAGKLGSVRQFATGPQLDRRQGGARPGRSQRRLALRNPSVLVQGGLATDWHV